MPKLPGRADTRPKVPLWLPLIDWSGPLLWEDVRCVIDGCGRLIKHLDDCARVVAQIGHPFAWYACGRCLNLIERLDADGVDRCLVEHPERGVRLCRIPLDQHGGHPGDHWNGKERWPNGDPANTKKTPPVEDEVRMMGQRRADLPR